MKYGPRYSTKRTYLYDWWTLAWHWSLYGWCCCRKWTEAPWRCGRTGQQEERWRRTAVLHNRLQESLGFYLTQKQHRSRSETGRWRKVRQRERERGMSYSIQFIHSTYFFCLIHVSQDGQGIVQASVRLFQIHIYKIELKYNTITCI